MKGTTTMTILLNFKSFSDAASACEDAEINAEALFAALTKAMHEALTTHNVGTGTAEALAIAAMPSIVRAVTNKSQVLHITGRSIGHHKIRAIKALRTHYNIGLGEAKDMVEAGEGHNFDVAITGFDVLPTGSLLTCAEELREVGYWTEIRPA